MGKGKIGNVNVELDAEAALELAKRINEIGTDSKKRRAFLVDEDLGGLFIKEETTLRPKSAETLREAVKVLNRLSPSERSLLLELNAAWPLQIDLTGAKGDPPLMAL